MHTIGVLLMVDSWILTIATAIKAFGFLDVSLECPVTSQMITCIAQGVIFVVQQLLGRVTLVLDVFHFYTIRLIVNWWSPKLFGNGFVTLSNMVSIGNSSSKVVRNLLRSTPDTLP